MPCMIIYLYNIFSFQFGCVLIYLFFILFYLFIYLFFRIMKFIALEDVSRKLSAHVLDKNRIISSGYC